MKLKEVLGSRSWLLAYIMSYVVVAMIVFSFLTSIFYSHFINILESKIENYYEASLSNQQTLFEERLRELESIALTIDDTYHMNFNYMEKSGYSSYVAVNTLKTLMKSNEFIYETALYYSESSSGKVASNTGVYPLEQFLSRFEFDKSDYALNTLKNVTSPTIIESIDGRMYMYVYPLWPITDKAEGLVLFVIDKSRIDDFFESILFLGSDNMFIYDRNAQKTLYEYNSDDNDVITIPDTPDQFDKVVTTKIDGKIYMTIDDSYNRWRYIYCVDESTLSKDVVEIKRFYVFVSAVVLLLTAAISFLLGYIIYKPWKKLMKRLAGSKDQKSMLPKDVYQRVDDIMTQNVTMLDTIKARSAVARDYTILTLFYGSDILDEEMGIILNKEKFRVLYIMPHQSMSVDRDAVESCFAEFGHAYCTRWMNDAAILLINYDSEFDISCTAEKLACDLPEISKIGISLAKEHTADIQTAFDEALRAAEYCALKNTKDICIFDDHWNTEQVAYNVELEQNLINALKLGDDEMARYAASCTIKAIRDSDEPLSVTKLRCFSLVNVIIHTMSEINLSEYYDKILDILNFVSLDNLEHQMYSLCSSICAIVDERRSEADQQHFAGIKSYIEEHYCDMDISLIKIANYFCLSPAHLSRTYKGAFGMTPKEYIEFLRMERVKALLRDTDWSVKDIVLSVGYIDLPNFTRKFKQTEGITPIQYRKISENDK